MRTLPRIFCQKLDAFAQRPTPLEQLHFPSKKTFKRFVGHVGCNFDKFDKIFTHKSPIISLNDQKSWIKFLHSKEASENCSAEHVERSFDNPASFIQPIIQTSLLEVRKWFEKTIFLQIFSSNFFSVLVGRFFDTLIFWFKDRKMLKLQYRWTIIIFSKKTDFSPQSASRSAGCSWDNPKRNFPTKGFLDQTPKKCEKYKK